MADQKISELTALTGANVADDDAIAIVDTSATETKKIVFSELKNALDTATGFVRITGDTMTGDLNVLANVGIGTSSPDRILHLNNSGTEQNVRAKFSNGTTGEGASDGFEIGINASSPAEAVLVNYEASPMAFFTSATEAMRIDASGNVGIGTSSPSNTIHVEQSVSGDWLGRFRNTHTTNGYGLLVYAGDDSSVQSLKVANHAGMGDYLVVRGDGNVGIGTSSPDTALEVSTSGSGVTDVLKLTTTSANSVPSILFEADAGSVQHDAARLRVGQTDQNNSAMIFEVQGSGSLSEAMRIDSSGNLLVGKTSNDNTTQGSVVRAGGQISGCNDGFPASIFNRKTSDGDITQFKKDGTAVGSIGSAVSATIYIDGGSQLAGLQFGGDGASEGRITPRRNGASADAATNLGTSSLRFKDLYLSGSIHGDVKFENNAGTTEYARFDSSGNLLVGKSSSGSSVRGTELRDGTSGFVATFKSDADGINIDRSTDGSLISLRKDGTTVGSIGVADSGDRIYLAGGGAEGVGIDNGANAFVPTSEAGAYKDNHMTLGRSDARFTDLYLSGGVYLGGTGSANKLDDYEEGTWTVYISDAASGGNVGSGTTTGYYTKIGRQVWVQAGISTSSGDLSAMTSGNTLYIQGLPYTSNSVSENRSQNIWLRGVSYGSGNVPYAYVSSNSSAIYFAITANNTFNFNPIEVSDYSGGDQIYVNIMYWV